MPDVPVSSLPPRQQKLLENARTALGIGNHAYTLEACAQILQTAPGCVEARRLHRQAQLRSFEERNNIISKAVGGLSSTPFIFSSATKDPLKAVASAERMLSADPTSASALKMLAEAAHGLDMMETVVFAREAVQELEPDDAENLRALADARKEALDARTLAARLQLAAELRSAWWAWQQAGQDRGRHEERGKPPDAQRHVGAHRRTPGRKTERRSPTAAVPGRR